MAVEKLPIKFFTPREVDKLRVEAGGSSQIPNWVLAGEKLKQRADILHQSFKQFGNAVKRRALRNSAVPFVFIAKMYEDATAKSRRAEISSLFQMNTQNNVIGLTASDELVVKIDSTSHMDKISSRLVDFENNRYAISCLETFQEFQPKIESFDEESSYKVKLIDFQDLGLNNAMQRLFEQTLHSKGIHYKKSDYTSQLPVYKVHVTPDTFLDTLRGNDAYDMLFSIEPMPKFVVSLDSIQDKSSISVMKPIDGMRYETLGILDGGISSIPQLSPWINEERWTVYPESDIDPKHGTFVAGVALYGDICEGENWVGHAGIKLFDATIVPKESNIDEDELIANIREAIQFKKETVKVWNLSVSVNREVSDTKFSDFAIALDDLQTEHNILICKSAGNCDNFFAGRPKRRINEGADSVRSLVVGSVAQAKGQYDLVDVGYPSPFSRVGPGPEYIIKPEVAHYGGNAGVNNDGELVISGITSFSTDESLSTSIGTSYSTPRIASLATGLYQELDEVFDPLLLKGLIIHSATYSSNLQIPETERTNQLGFGVPKSISQILYNEPYEATLILRDTLEKGHKIDIMDFPMPKSLIRDGYYTGQIIATLVYDPILDSSQGIEYCQSNIDIKFGSFNRKEARDDKNRRNILNPVGRAGTQNLLRRSLYSKRLMRENQNEFALRERLLIQYADKYYPIKKYAVDLSELSAANKRNYATEDKLWFLYLAGLYREHTEQRARLEGIRPSQKFCLILTIRDPEQKANVYDDITQTI